MQIRHLQGATTTRGSAPLFFKRVLEPSAEIYKDPMGMAWAEDPRRNPIDRSKNPKPKKAYDLRIRV